MGINRQPRATNVSLQLRRNQCAARVVTCGHILGVLQVELNGAGRVLQKELSLGELGEHAEHEHILQARGGAKQQLHRLQTEPPSSGRRPSAAAAAAVTSAEQLITETALSDQVVPGAGRTGEGEQLITETALSDQVVPGAGRTGESEELITETALSDQVVPGAGRTGEGEQLITETALSDQVVPGAGRTGGGG